MIELGDVIIREATARVRVDAVRSSARIIQTYEATMRIAYLDCFSGIAGDMLLAALLDAGAPLDRFQESVRALSLSEVTLAVERVKRHGIAANYVRVEIDAAAPRKHRHLSHIVKIIDAAGLPPRVADQAKRIFTRLAEAEALVHQTTVEKVHFHEVGAADAIVDIVCACVGFSELGIGEIVCSPIPTGSGAVTCDHGIMPVPAPATAQLLRGVPIAACDETGELATPTGAAIATTLASSFGPPPAMTLSAVGVGCGTREGRTRPNILRVLIGDTAETTPGYEHDVVVQLEAQVDDATGQAAAFALENALAAGALDAYAVPIIMKKGRPGMLLTVLCEPHRAADMEELLLTQTPTFGVRRSGLARVKLGREHVTVATPYGDIRVKLGRRGEVVVHAAPEYEDCAAAARRANVRLDDVRQAALRAYQG